MAGWILLGSWLASRFLSADVRLSDGSPLPRRAVFVLWATGRRLSACSDAQYRAVPLTQSAHQQGRRG